MYFHEPAPYHTKEEVEIRARELKRDFNIPLSVQYIVVSITLGLLLIVGLVLVYAFHLV